MKNMLANQYSGISLFLSCLVVYKSKIQHNASSTFKKTSYRVATNLENMENLENSGNLKNCQNLRENSGKFELL